MSSFRKQLNIWGSKPSHAGSVLREFYRGNGRVDFSQIQIGKPLEIRLADPLLRSKVLHRHQSADGTVKLLVGFAAGGAVEAVLMPSHRPADAAGCVSSQIGCAMGCDFCASTRGGLVRNLSAGEIVEQFLHLRAQAARTARRLKTLVFMGMGEPMHNLDNVIPAIRRIADPALGALGWRQITVSTVGIVPGIDALADADLNVHLAVSLHAPDDQTRSRLVPMNKRYRVADVIDATRRFEQRTGRIPTIEYCMLAGVNDSDAQANLLASLLSGLRFHINLIPYNPIGAGVSGTTYQAPAPERVHRFLAILRGAGAVAHVRRPRGDDISAACGQLRQSFG